MGRKWEMIVREAEEIASEYRAKYNVAPTLRGIFYILVSKGLISNTKSNYVYLSKTLASKRYAGEFSWELIDDTTRRAIRRMSSEYVDDNVETALHRLRSYIDTSIDLITRFYVNPWDDQEYRVIITLEKDALFTLIDNMINRVTKELVDGEVWERPAYVDKLVVMRGYNSATEMYRLVKEIESLPEDVTPVILHLGDFDPSGEDIMRDLKERLSILTKRNNIVFEKISITLEQIMSLNIPAIPAGGEEEKKLIRDPRYKSFVKNIEELAKIDHRYRELIEKYRRPDGKVVMRVELDALAALYPKYLENVLKTSIKKYFNIKTYYKTTKPKIEEQRRKTETLRQELRKRIAGVLERTNQ
jgi:hypothetical protein